MITVAESRPDIRIPTDTPHFALTGELWGVSGEDFGEHLPRYNGTTLYDMTMTIFSLEKWHLYIEKVPTFLTHKDTPYPDKLCDMICAYFGEKDNDNCPMKIRQWTHRSCPIPHPHRWAMGYPLQVFWREITSSKEMVQLQLQQDFLFKKSRRLWSNFRIFLTSWMRNLAAMKYHDVSHANQYRSHDKPI